MTRAAWTSSWKSASRPRPSRSPRQQEVIQTETGAREGVLSSKQIDNLSIMGRSALELLRILPGVVTDFNIGESTGAAKDVQNYTVNGIRSSGNTAQLDGSNLLDIGCNCGMMVSLNNDMIPRSRSRAATSRPSTAPAA